MMEDGGWRLKERWVLRQEVHHVEVPGDLCWALQARPGCSGFCLRPFASMLARISPRIATRVSTAYE